jgi:hypothetical protein
LATALDEAEWDALRFTSDADAYENERRFRSARMTIALELAAAERLADADNDNASTIPPRPRAGSVRRGLDT